MRENIDIPIKKGGFKLCKIRKKKFCLYTLFIIILNYFLLTPLYKTKAFIPISPIEVKQIINSPSSSAIIIDVRTPKEYSKGHLKNSINIPLQILKDSILSKNIDKNSKIVVYCSSGVRSKKATTILNSIGYNNVSELGGINNWPYELEK